MESLARALSVRATFFSLVVQESIDGVALVAAVATHRDREAFTRLVEFYAPRVRGYLMARGASTSIADELTQEVMLKVWLKAVQFDPERGQVGAWLFAITRNCFATHRERQRWPDPEAAATPQSVAAPEELLLTAERGQHLLDAMGALPVAQRDILAGAYYRGRTMRQLADEQGIPLGTVKTRVRLALARLRHLLTGGSPNADV
jgi:RNA polymerase sigma-70 factor (ECF subfamily)